MVEINNVLCALLKLVGLRQIEVARELGVNRSTLAGWLSGYSPMPDEAILGIHKLVCSRLPTVHPQSQDRGISEASHFTGATTHSGSEGSAS